MAVLQFLLGLIIGSFLNVVIYRLPRGEGFIRGRSHCPHCGHALAWQDLIPIASYLVLRGCCRSCHQRISFQYPLVELASGLIFVFAPSIAALVLVELFLVLGVIDLRRLLIPDVLLVALIIVGIASGAVLHWGNLWSAVGIAGFFFMLWFVSRGKWIGFGDVKLGGVLGLLFGFPGGLMVLYLGIIVGGLISAVILVSRRAGLRTKVPLGSFLALAAIAYLLFQDAFFTILARYSMLGV